MELSLGASFLPLKCQLLQVCVCGTNVINRKLLEDWCGKGTQAGGNESLEIANYLGL